MSIDDTGTNEAATRLLGLEGVNVIKVGDDGAGGSVAYVVTAEEGARAPRRFVLGVRTHALASFLPMSAPAQRSCSTSTALLPPEHQAVRRSGRARVEQEF
ncbi:hypothetical protein ACFRCW_33375 [Streptomyces sp. NPDC056653]|uniref:hypothetical protein n=1 Tax=Streptomyces sp. NPDC056653 TaxID=3345894 RepID=UPI0036A75731